MTFFNWETYFFRNTECICEEVSNCQWFGPFYVAQPILSARPRRRAVIGGGSEGVVKVTKGVGVSVRARATRHSVRRCHGLMVRDGARDA